MLGAVLPILGALLQIALLWMKEQMETKEENKKKAKELKDEFKETLKNRDYSKLNILWERARRMR
jgi:uncharacterized membrane protein (DUF106 family)